MKARTQRLLTAGTLAASMAVAIALGQNAPAGPGGDAAIIRLGERQLRQQNGALAWGVPVHDPSTIVKCGDEYWTFFTGNRVPCFHSKDLAVWEAGPPVFPGQVSWVPQAVPQNNGNSFWAPDVIKVGDKYMLFYSASSFGVNTSAIGVVTNPTLDPGAANFKWTDGGMVIQSKTADNFNCIDPAALLDTDGKLWLSFGSFWSGIQLIELDPQTGRRVAPNAPIYNIAHWDSIEASYLYKHGNYYYLFASLGMCCRGANSTYHTVVGRSEKVTGPYVDKSGKDMLLGGGESILDTAGQYIGPGHAGIIEKDGKSWLSHHYYNGNVGNGQSRLAIRPLTWSAQGWPIAGTMDDVK